MSIKLFYIDLEYNNELYIFCIIHLNTQSGSLRASVYGHLQNPVNWTNAVRV